MNPLQATFPMAIYSESEDGWWSNDDGWVSTIEDATIFDSVMDDVSTMYLPFSSKNDAKWVDLSLD